MKFLLFLALFVVSGVFSLFAEQNFQHTSLSVVRMHPSQIRKPVTEAQKITAVISEITQNKTVLPQMENNRGKCDFALSGFQMLDSPLETGRTFRFKIVVSNLSRDTRCPASQVDMQVLMNGKLASTFYFNTDPINSYTNLTCTVTHDGTLFIWPGTYNLRFVVDPNNQVSEANEKNNVHSPSTRYTWNSYQDLTVERILVPEIMKMGETLVMKTYVTNNGKSHAMPFKIITKIGDWEVADDIDWVLDPGTTLEIPDKISGFPEGDFKIERILSFPHWWDKAVTYTKDPEPNSASVMLYVRDTLIADVQADSFNVLTEPLVAGEEMEFELVSSGRDFPPMPASVQDPIQNRIMYVPEGKFRNRADWVTLYKYDVTQSALLDKIHYEKALVPPEVFSCPSGIHLLAYVVDWTMVVGTDTNQDNDYIFRELEFKSPLIGITVAELSLKQTPYPEPATDTNSFMIDPDRELQVDIKLETKFPEPSEPALRKDEKFTLKLSYVQGTKEIELKSWQIPIKELYNKGVFYKSEILSPDKLQNLPGGEGKIKAKTEFSDDSQFISSQKEKNTRISELYVKWLAEENESPLCADGNDLLSLDGALSVPEVQNPKDQPLFVPELFKCSFMVGRLVKDGNGAERFVPLKNKNIALTIRENTEHLTGREPQVLVYNRTYYAHSGYNDIVTTVKPDSNGLIKDLILASRSSYQTVDYQKNHFDKKATAKPEPGRIYFENCKLYPPLFVSGEKERNYLEIPQWFRRPQHLKYGILSNDSPVWFNTAMTFYLDGIAKHQGSNLVRVFARLGFLSNWNFYKIYAGPAVSPNNTGIVNPVYGLTTYGKGWIDTNCFFRTVRQDLKMSDIYDDQQFWINHGLFGTFLHETRHAYQYNMHLQTDKPDKDKDQLIDPAYVEEHKLAKDDYGYILDGSENYLGVSFKGDLINDRNYNEKDIIRATEWDARKFGGKFDLSNYNDIFK